MRNVGVTGNLLYLLKSGRLQHYVGVGIQYQHGLQKMQREAEYNNASSQYINYQLSYRVTYKLNDSAKFFVQPNLVRTLVAKEALGLFTNKQYRPGIAFGLLYQF